MLTPEEFEKLEEAIYAYNDGKHEEALAVFSEFAERKNDDESQYYLGLMYFNGQAVEKDKEQAIYWWKKSADQRNMDAQFQLETLSMTKNTRY